MPSCNLFGNLAQLLSQFSSNFIKFSESLRHMKNQLIQKQMLTSH